jgi:maltose O-acetyltransferase
MRGSDGRSEKEKMLAGELYRAIGPELAADNLRADRLMRAYNATRSASGRMSGSELGRLSCPASASGTMPSSGRAAW